MCCEAFVFNAPGFQTELRVHQKHAKIARNKCEISRLSPSKINQSYYERDIQINATVRKPKEIIYSFK
jgi:hypothetical protein